MLQFKDAIKQSFKYLEEMYEGQELANKLLEEIEYDEKEDIWKVVIGFDTNKMISTEMKSPFSSMMSSIPVEKKLERKYKQIRLKGADGSWIKMIDERL